ncbi:hypothetical protein JHD50_03975 [Sulfurimonas sp. MAG313]|nr:hypothetical protein [Sulfurimonas sp. MAG313]MDF1880468.1 hypothetical protein [Sulfurimonas sp. MAG313]
MIAFNHNVIAPFIGKENLKRNALKTLTVLKKRKKITPLAFGRSYEQNQGREVSLSTDISFIKNVQNQKWVFEVKDIVSFYWEQSSYELYYYEGENGNATLSKYWFLHTFLPVFLSIEDKFELIHAGGVELKGKPVLFIAPSYGGKSTITDYFLKKGHIMVSDDRVGIYEDTLIKTISSYPYHRPYRKMEDLGIKVENFMTTVKNLHIIYLLQRVNPLEKISFELLEGIETFKALQYNFDFILPLNKARSFELIAKIASKIEIYKLSVPWDLERLDEVYQEICKHSNSRK